MVFQFGCIEKAQTISQQQKPARQAGVNTKTIGTWEGLSPYFSVECPETRMDKRSSGGMGEEWRQQGFSGQPLGILAMGVACRGGAVQHQARQGV